MVIIVAVVEIELPTDRMLELVEKKTHLFLTISFYNRLQKNCGKISGHNRRPKGKELYSF